jgi:hypothetical protein
MIANQKPVRGDWTAHPRPITGRDDRRRPIQKFQKGEGKLNIYLIFLSTWFVFVRTVFSEQRGLLTGFRERTEPGATWPIQKRQGGSLAFFVKKWPAAI